MGSSNQLITPRMRQRAKCKVSLSVLWKLIVSDIFDRNWYTDFYMLEGKSKTSPLLYFAFHGIFKNHSPNPDFHAGNYIKLNPDVLKFNDLPIIHYFLFGYDEKRKYHIITPKEESDEYPYQRYLDTHEGGWQKHQEIPDGPLFSIVCPVYKVPFPMLQECIASVKNQTYTKWELCITFSDPENETNQTFLRTQALDDSRIKIKDVENQGISGNTNEALTMASGEYICLLDHDDILAPRALEFINRAILHDPTLDFLYSDKDRLNHATGQRFHPLCKPEWSPEMLYSANYLTHFNVIRKSLVEKIGGFRTETDGAQDWDMFLRVTELTNAIRRTPHMLYHWRVHMQSTSSSMEAKPYAQAAQLTTLQDALKRRNLPAKVSLRDTHFMHVQWDSVASIPVHILIDATGSPQARVEQLVGIAQRELLHSSISSGRISVIHSLDAEVVFPDSEFPLTSVRCQDNNTMAHEMETLVSTFSEKDQVLVFLNGGIDALRQGWLSELAGWTGLHPDIGFCGGFVLNPKKEITSSMLLLSERGEWIDLFQQSRLHDHTALGEIRWYRNCSAMLPHFVAVKRAALPSTGIFLSDIPWHDAFVHACRTMREQGFRGLLNPWLIAHSVELLIAATPYEYTFRSDPYCHPAINALAPVSLLRKEQNTMLLFQPDKYNLDTLIFTELSQYTENHLYHLQALSQRKNIHDEGNKIVCRWFILYISNPGFGEEMTIFRFADYLARRGKVENVFIVNSKEDTAAMQQSIRSLFPSLMHSECIRVETYDMQPAMYPCINIATFWPTTYLIKNRIRDGLMLYFIQDFEPAFYPTGSLYTLAAHSYRMGFHTIANTKYLLDLQTEKYGGKGTYFTPQVDTEMFYPPESKTTRTRRRIFFYARPQHPRNGFELAATALRQLKKNLGNEVEIICAGEDFDVDAFGLQGIVTSLGILDYHKTAEVYRSCDIGFTLMLSHHPSYLTMELMASGLLLVTNYNEANEWLLKDNKNCLLTWPIPDLLAKRLEDAVIHFDNYREIQQNGTDLIHTTLNDWESAFENVCLYIEEQWRGLGDK